MSASHASGRNDLFVTAGDRTLKLWSFSRPKRIGGSAEEPASILCCNAIMGKGAKGNSKFPVDHAPIYYCVAFIKQSNEGYASKIADFFKKLKVCYDFCRNGCSHKQERRSRKWR